MPEVEVNVKPGTTLGRLLKFTGQAETGGHAKVLIDGGLVTVNGKTERRRGHKVQDGDLVTVLGVRLRVSVHSAAPEGPSTASR